MSTQCMLRVSRLSALFHRCSSAISLTICTFADDNQHSSSSAQVNFGSTGAVLLRAVSASTPRKYIFNSTFTGTVITPTWANIETGSSIFYLFKSFKLSVQTRRWVNRLFSASAIFPIVCSNKNTTRSLKIRPMHLLLSTFSSEITRTRSNSSHTPICTHRQFMPTKWPFYFSCSLDQTNTD